MPDQDHIFSRSAVTSPGSNRPTFWSMVASMVEEPQNSQTGSASLRCTPMP